MYLQKTNEVDLDALLEIEERLIKKQTNVINLFFLSLFEKLKDLGILQE